MNLLLVAVGGYLVGTVSFARLIGRIALPGENLGETNYAIPGTEDTWTYRGVSASSVVERAGWKWGTTVIVLDGLKGLLPTLVLRLAYPESAAFAVAAIAVMVGHVWSLP